MRVELLLGCGFLFCLLLFSVRVLLLLGGGVLVVVFGVLVVSVGVLVVGCSGVCHFLRCFLH